jgi:manganese-dependent inorganic pyrophosphatase
MTRDELLVIGHRNPDTDAICSAIAYAEFKRRTGSPDAEAARCGDTNPRISFVLETFGCVPPRFVADVSPKVRDVMQKEVVRATPDHTVAEALALMDDHALRVLPVLDGSSRCTGLVSVFKMNKFFCPSPHRIFESRRVLASLNRLARTLSAELILPVEADREEELILIIGAMSEGTFAGRLEEFPAGRLLVIVGDRREIQRQAILAGVRGVVLTGGFQVESEIMEEARSRGVVLMVSPHDTATTAVLCRSAVAVNHVLHEQFHSFREDDTLADARQVAAASRLHAFPVIDEEGRTVGMLSKSDFLKKVRRQLILVDHNELSQAVHGAEQVEIIEIIDHHRIGSLATRQPILFRNEPVGSTSTIVADCFFRQHVELSRSIAGLLLAGIVSDTLNLSSPTTTDKDKQILSRLEGLAGVKATDFASKLFASGSVLISLAAPQAIVSDCKEFEHAGRRFSVAQVEELGFDRFWEQKAALQVALEEYRTSHGYYFSALLITDIVRKNSLLLMAGVGALAQRMGYPVLAPGVFELEGVVSRKKEVIPHLLHCLEEGGISPRPLTA